MLRVVMITISAICIVFPLLANATAGWSGRAEVTGIYTLNESTTLIKLSTFSNPNDCQINSGGDVRINPSVDKNWMNMFLAAYMSGKPVNVYVSAACTGVWAGTSYATVGHVRLL
ncbi:hypothetical protein HWQ46_26360 [Shewanella sp. D64]|uniref:hypothetical protein n=1 Tax=unclassified Shewanella TaxID=196818 RepID=UPI0022BA3244|nr:MULTISPECIES: hypothetical protein [unclassified Shewanella]MEC4729040.1 hypothetical protein [Shewanella sp. D64]MEC4737901.1 hypothetical protein [Shewanella sp. E94]WBJ93846.1 hypothetical protein HWQ47_18195 [Shewanella sp. MTB7]